MDADTIQKALRDVVDPEVGINIVDLGLVYDIAVDGRAISIRMTMTSPACPLGEHIVDEVEAVLAGRFPDATAQVDLVWEPPWRPEKITVEGRRQLGWPEAG